DDQGIVHYARDLDWCVQSLAGSLDRMFPLKRDGRVEPLWLRRLMPLLRADIGIGSVAELAVDDENELKTIEVGLGDHVLGHPLHDVVDFRLLANVISSSLPVLRSINRACRLEWSVPDALAYDQSAGPDAIFLHLERPQTTDTLVLPILLIGSLFQQM